MFLSDISIKRPVAVTCLTLALVMLGANAYRRLGLELIPRLAIPEATILTVWPGATPGDLEADVAKRIEEAVAAVEGLKHTTTIAMDDLCQTSIEFAMGTDIDKAVADVRAELDAIYNDLPEGCEKPVVVKVDVNAAPVATLAFAGGLPMPLLYDYADQQLSERLSSIPGVANVDLIGGAEREVHVLLDRERLSAAGLSGVDVVDAVRRGIRFVPAGRVRKANREYNVRYDAEFPRASDIVRLPVVDREGAKRYIGDLGRVEAVASEEIRQASFIDGQPCIGIQVVKRADANAVEVVDAVRREVEALAELLPGGTELVWVADDAGFIRAAVDTTGACIVAGMILTAALLFLFLFNLNAAVVTIVTMPATIVMSLFFMQASGFTLNVVTLQALALSVGALVTDSIEVMESVASRLEEGKPPRDAAREGAADVAAAVLASAGTNMVVLLPIGLMGEIVGMLFRPFALTMLYTNLASLFTAFTITPILCVYVLKRRGGRGLLARMGDFAGRLTASLARLLAGALRFAGSRRWPALAMVAATAALFVLSLGLAEDLGFDMFPSIDKGQMNIKLEYPAYQNLDQTILRLKDAEERLAGLPGLVHLLSNVGKVNAAPGNPSEGVYLVSMTVALEDKTERALSMDEIMDRVRTLLADHGDCVITPSKPEISGGEDIPIQLRIGGDDLGELKRIALALRTLLAEEPGFLDVSASVKDEREEIRVRPNRPALAEADIPPDWLGEYLRAGVDGVKAARFRSDGRSFDIRVKYAEREGVEQVGRLQVPLHDGTVLLGQYADIAMEYAPVTITRSDRSRMSMVFAFLEPEYPLSTAMDRINELIAEHHLLPPGYTAASMGMEEWMDDSLAAFAEAAIIAVILTFFTLSAVLESFRRSLYIMLAVPLGLMGVITALSLTGVSMDMFVLLGCVLLVGIVVNNAVLLFDHAGRLELRGVPPGEAMLRAVVEEFRPIVMITLAAIFGMLPLALATGLGNEISVGIGVASVGGIAASGVLTLVVIPALFLVFNRPPSGGPREHSLKLSPRGNASR